MEKRKAPISAARAGHGQGFVRARRAQPRIRECGARRVGRDDHTVDSVGAVDDGSRLLARYCAGQPVDQLFDRSDSDVVGLWGAILADPPVDLPFEIGAVRPEIAEVRRFVIDRVKRRDRIDERRIKAASIGRRQARERAVRKGPAFDAFHNVELRADIGRVRLAAGKSLRPGHRREVGQGRSRLLREPCQIDADHFVAADPAIATARISRSSPGKARLDTPKPVIAG